VSFINFTKKQPCFNFVEPIFWQIMNWKNSLRDGPPQNNQEVLICVSGIYHLAVYKAPNTGFEIDDHQDFIPVKDTVYWTEISVPVPMLKQTG
jgi:hypothetical protein